MSKIDKRFLKKHSIDWFRDIGGCETCGPEYEINCACGWSGSDAYGYNDHVLEMADSWIGDGPEITREPDV